MNKKGFELAINSLVIIVLAIALLGVGLMFIFKIGLFQMPEIPQKCDIYPPSAESPVCINSEVNIKRSSQISTTVSVYNNEDKDISASLKPNIECGTNVEGQKLNLKVTSTGLTIPVSESGNYKIIIHIPKDAPRSMFPCTFSISETQKQFSIVVA